MANMIFRQRIFDFSRLVAQSYGLSADQLVAVIKARDQFTVRMRAAALRNLVCSAPLAVTQGRPYAERRRLARAHYGV
jgi:hypothetical protein